MQIALVVEDYVIGVSFKNRSSESELKCYFLLSKLFLRKSSFSQFLKCTRLGFVYFFKKKDHKKCRLISPLFAVKSGHHDLCISWKWSSIHLGQLLLQKCISYLLLLLAVEVGMVDHNKINHLFVASICKTLYVWFGWAKTSQMFCAPLFNTRLRSTIISHLLLPKKVECK